MAETHMNHPPRSGLERFRPVSFEIREADGTNMPTLFGYMLRFNEWTEIQDLFGTYLERIAPGAASRTLKYNASGVKILFNHGFDPSIGEKPLASPNLVEDNVGLRYEGQLFDTSYNRDLVPALKAGELGSSFKFNVVSDKEDYVESPKRSEYNPEGIPERTIHEIKLFEGGPVTFPAYAGATAGARSRAFIEGLRMHPEAAPDELESLVKDWVERNPQRARSWLPAAEAESTASASERTLAITLSGDASQFERGLSIAATSPEATTAPSEERTEDAEEEARSAIAYKHTGTSMDAWDGSKTKAEIPTDATAEQLRAFFAWVDPEADPTTKTAYKFVHHQVADGEAGDASIVACHAGIAVLNGARNGTTIPDADRQGVYDHLAHHIKDAGEEPASLRAMNELEETEPPDGTPDPDAAQEAEEEAGKGARSTSDALHGAEGPHSGWSRDGSTDQAMPPWHRKDEPSPPWARGK